MAEQPVKITRQAWHQGDEFSKIDFQIRSVVDKLHTATLVRVEDVHIDEQKKIRNVDVLPLVKQLKADGTALEQAIIYNVPFFRLQMGKSAVICNPKKGDIGLCIFAQHDIGAVKNTFDKAPPLSLRRFDSSDGLYLGGFLNEPPEQWVSFDDDNGIIDIHARKKLTISAEAIEIKGKVTHSDGDLISNNITLNKHTHGGIQPGTANTAQPNKDAV